VPAPNENPFALLSVVPAFDIDESAIERAFLKRIGMIHPDRLQRDESGESENEVAALNRAKASLLNPEHRANLYLALLGGHSAQSDKSLPPGFLMEIMDVRQQIEADLEAGPAARDKWIAWSTQERTAYVQTLVGLFQQAAAGSRDTLGSIRQSLNAWRYIERLIEQLDPRYNPNQNQ